MPDFIKIATAIRKYDSNTAKRPFELRTRRGVLCFASKEEACAHRVVQLAIRAIIKRRYRALSQEEKRERNVQKHGGDSNMERRLAFEIKEMFKTLYPDIEVIILNDGTRADMLIRRTDGLYLQLQLKTTRRHREGRPNSWTFRHMRGYTHMFVLCWRYDQASGWIYDGTKLNHRNIENLCVSSKGVNRAMAFGGVKTMPQLCEFLMDNQYEFPGIDAISASWDFAGNAMSTFKERVCLELWKIHFDTDAIFPEEPNGSFDLFSKQERLQFKCACRMKDQTALHVCLKENAGRVDGKLTRRPYTCGSFDAVVVMNLDWSNNKVHVWKIPEDVLIQKEFLKTDTCKGKVSFYVYHPDEKHLLRLNKAKEPRADVWTHGYFLGTKEIPMSFGEEAETIAARFFAECRGV